MTTMITDRLGTRVARWSCPCAGIEKVSLWKRRPSARGALGVVLAGLVLLVGDTLLPPAAAFTLQTGLHYYALENLDTGEVEQRGQAGSNGIAHVNLIMAPTTRYRNWILQAATFKIGYSEFTTPVSGRNFTLPDIFIRRSKAPDSDDDGLPDDGEFVMGTNPNNPDTDGDGLLDGAEVRQGMDPLDSFPARTGILASADTPGIAKDICAINDVAIVADGDRGISVFNVFNGMNPTIVAQVDTQGDAKAVSCSGTLIAVADGPQGVAIIDISDPPAARILHQLPLGGDCQAVVSAAGIAYVGVRTGQLVSVDMASGTVIDRLTMGSPVHDVAIDGDTLYVALTREVRAYELAPGALTLLSTAAASGFQPESITDRRRLFVGGGIAYLTSYPGYDTFNVSNPRSIFRIAIAVDAGPNSFKQIVVNGSGVGLATVGDVPRDTGRHHLSRYDVSNPAVTTGNFISTYETPGTARAVAIYNGLAYVADSAAGMQVINYLAFDTLGVPPTIALATNFAPGVAEEGKTMRVTALAEDDVQVRNVEFYVDGRLRSTDGNFPFEFRFTTPLIAQQPKFLLRARATDTGGNAVWSATQEITLTPDATPPRVVGVSPRPGAVLGSVNTITAAFSEPIRTTTLNPGTFLVRQAGPDNVFGTPDDVQVSSGSTSYRDEIRTAFLTYPVVLIPGLYQGVVTVGVTDRAGNPLAQEFTWTFRIFSQVDLDQDGIPDDLEPLLGLDPNDNDSDNDGIFDGDEDFDRDGSSNSCELVMQTDPTNRDSDGDGILDGSEDTDFDFVPDGEECQRGTNPFVADSDGDGVADVDELAIGTDPNQADSRPGTRTASVPVSYLNALLGQPDRQRFVSSQPVSYLNALLGQADQARFVSSQPVSYLNAIVGEPGTARFAIARPVSYLNAIVVEDGGTRFAVSRVVSYRNEATLAITLHKADQEKGHESQQE